MDIDIDTFKARRGWKQLSFWIALAPILLALLPTDARDWIATHWQAVAASSGPLVAWLLSQGYVRGQGVASAGEYAKSLAVMEPLRFGQDDLVDEPDDGFGAVSTGGAHDDVNVDLEKRDAEAEH